MSSKRATPITIEQENPITTEQENLLSQVRPQLDEITALPNFAKLTCEALNKKLLHVFVPEDSPIP
jgi:hypothetical protein